MKIRILLKKAAALSIAAVTALSVTTQTAFAANDIGTILNKLAYDVNGNVIRFNSSADVGGYTAGGIAICKENTSSVPTEVGNYRGFRLEIFYDIVSTKYCVNLCGAMKHTVALGSDALGNITRIENEISKFPARLEAAKTKKSETISQLETAKVEVEKPFAFEKELKEKTKRLNSLNIELNLDKKDPAVLDDEPEQNDKQIEKKTVSLER